MPENRDTDIILRILFADAFGIMHRTPVFFCNDYDTAVLALAEPSADELLKLVYVSIVLRYDGGLGPGGNGTVLCKKTRIAAHHFDKEYAVMGSCGVADLVHALHYGIERRIISYGGIRSVKVIVYRSRQSYARDIEFLGEYLRTGKRAVSSYDDQGIDTVLDHIVISFLPAFRRHEILRSCSLENGTSPLDSTADTLGCHLLYLIIYQSFITSINAHDFPAVENRGPCHGPDSSIHSRRIAPGCQYTYGRNIPCHTFSPLKLHKDKDYFEIMKLAVFLSQNFICLMKIGNIDLGAKPLFLAPMEDVTDASFRFVCKEFGADMMYTEFISSDGLIRDAKKSLAKLVTYDYEAPIGIQIYGNIPEAMVDAARMAENAAEIAGGHGADLIDINFGCPVSKIARRGAGSGMMREPDKMVEITRMVVNAVKLPVTVKTRLGWDENSKIIVELAERLQDTGIQALTIHGRTRCQMYTGEADWTLIGKVKENPRMHIPRIGNGDINSPQKAAEAFDRYGVDGIMIGRATYGHPWIFKEIRHYLQTGELLPQMSVCDRVELAKRHLAKSLEFKGDRVGILEMRRHLSCYFKGLPDFKETRLKLVTLNDPQELYTTLDYIADRWGDTEAPAATSVYGQ